MKFVERRTASEGHCVCENGIGKFAKSARLMTRSCST